ncbi:MAG: hypothetical protein JWR00_3118 [Rubritepida sp.]|nr:hypothetical protein [Rubritepida sp.]
MCLDQGTIRAGEARLPVSEIELELKQGELTALVAAALSLHHMLPQAVLSVDSKASRGWQLRTGEHGPAAKADDLDLPEEVPVAEAFGQVLGNCLSQLLANQAAVLAGDAEGVHQMRVSIRRMRAGLRLFRPLLRREALAEIEEELRQLGRVLGAARDWDVFADETLPAAKPELGGRNAAAMREAAEAERQAAHAVVVAALNAPGFTGLMLRLVEARIDPAPLLRPNCDAAPLEEEVSALLARLQRKARKRGRGIAKRSPEELHGLRKSLKKLRYGTEFLRGVLKAKRARRFLHGLKDLQTQLGAMNDAAVAAQLAETLRHRHGAMDIAATRLAHRVGREREEAHSALPKAWKRFRKAELPA